jgi:hypothetical protein
LGFDLSCLLFSFTGIPTKSLSLLVIACSRIASLQTITRLPACRELLPRRCLLSLDLTLLQVCGDALGQLAILGDALGQDVDAGLTRPLGAFW